MFKKFKKYIYFNILFFLIIFSTGIEKGLAFLPIQMQPPPVNPQQPPPPPAEPPPPPPPAYDVLENGVDKLIDALSGTSTFPVYSDFVFKDNKTPPSVKSLDQLANDANGVIDIYNGLFELIRTGKIVEESEQIFKYFEANNNYNIHNTCTTFSNPICP